MNDDTDYEFPSEERMRRGLEYMSKVAGRVRASTITYDEGVQELMDDGMTEGDAREWLENVTDSKFWLPSVLASQQERAAQRDRQK